MASSYTSSPRQADQDDGDFDDNDSLELDEDPEYYEQGSDEGVEHYVTKICSRLDLFTSSN